MISGSATSIVCCTTNNILSEPRAPKFAAALSNQFPNACITLIDAHAGGDDTGPLCISAGTGTVRRKTCSFPTKRSNVVKRLLVGIFQTLFRGIYRVFGKPDVRSVSIVAPYLRQKISTEKFDLILGHNIDTLPIICEMGRSQGAKVVFDCMEYYSDMGDGQSDLTRRAIRDLEELYLPQCDVVFASSREVAEMLRKQYGLKSVVPIYNATAVTCRLAPKLKDGRFHLYWRNATVGMSQRGLQDAIEALSFLAPEIVLNIQGRPGQRMAALMNRIAELGVEDRIVFHDAFAVGDAVLSASQFSVGLCPERDTCLNQRLTVSNKIFDYLMAGLAVVCSDLPGLASVVNDSRAGILCRSGDARDLARKIHLLYEDRELLEELQSNARVFSTTRVNEVSELNRVCDEISRLGL